MKKLVSAVLVCVMAVSLFGMTAFAAGSATETADITKAVDKSGAAVTVLTEDAEDPAAADIVDLIGEGATTDDITVLWTQDLSVPEGTEFPVTITFNAEGTEGQMLYVLHYGANGWEIVGQGEGPSVEATFNSLSPVCLVAKNLTAAAEETEAAPAETAPAAPASTTPAAPASTTPAAPAAQARNAAATSPATGDSSQIALFASILVIAGVAAAAAVSRKRA